jgi:ribosome-binding factor A
MMASQTRHERVKRAIQREVSLILKEELRDPRLEDQVISVTEVDLTSDLTFARIYLSIFADTERQNELMTLILESEKKVRRALGQRLQLRQAPEIRLLLDDSLERGARMTRLLDQISKGEL